MLVLKSQSLSLAFLFVLRLVFAICLKSEKAVKKKSECRTSAKTCYTIARYNSILNFRGYRLFVLISGIINAFMFTKRANFGEMRKLYYRIKNITIIGFVAKDCRNCCLFAHIKIIFCDMKFSNYVSCSVSSKSRIA